MLPKGPLALPVYRVAGNVMGEKPRRASYQTAISCPSLFFEFWEELGRTEASGRENLDVAKGGLSTVIWYLNKCIFQR